VVKATVYVVALTEPTANVFHTTLHALDLANGSNVKPPVEISPSAVLSDGSTLTFDAKNDLVFIEAPKGAGSVRKLETATGKISTIAEGMNEPHGLTVDGQGRYVIADTFNHRIVRVDPATGALTVIAGAKERKGFAGDGGPATAATLDQPRQVSSDKAGNLFFADDSTNRVRRIGTDGVITTVAGNGTTNVSGDDGPALAAGMRGVWGVVVNAAGDLFIASPPAARVRKVDAKTGIITAVGTP